LLETFLPDGTIVETFNDNNIISSEVSLRHLFKRPDYSAISIDSSGNIDIMTSNTRSAHNEANGRKGMG